MLYQQTQYLIISKITVLHRSTSFQSKFKILDVFFFQNDTSGETTLTASKLENTYIARSDVSKTATDSHCHGWFLVAASSIHTEMIYYHYSQHSQVNDYEPPTDPVINHKSWLKYFRILLWGLFVRIKVWQCDTNQVGFEFSFFCI